MVESIARVRHIRVTPMKARRVVDLIRGRQAVEALAILQHLPQDASEPVYKLVAAGKVDTNKVKVFATTPAYYDYNWTVRGNLDPALTDKIKAAFLALDPAKPADKAILDLQAATRFIPTKAENYTGIEEAARAAGLLK